MNLSPGTTRYGYFLTKGSTGSVVAPDSLPVVMIYYNGVVQGSISPTVSSVSTGRYSYSWSVPSGWVGGDQISEVITWAVSAVSYGLVNECMTAAIDGLSVWRAQAAMLAVLLGQVQVNGSVMSFLGQNGSSVKVQVTVGNGGVRTASTVP